MLSFVVSVLCLKLLISVNMCHALCHVLCLLQTVRRLQVTVCRVLCLLQTVRRLQVTEAELERAEERASAAETYA